MAPWEADETAVKLHGWLPSFSAFPPLSDVEPGSFAVCLCQPQSSMAGLCLLTHMHSQVPAFGMDGFSVNQYLVVIQSVSLKVLGSVPNPSLSVRYV